ncbi:MAG: aldo/keto reductase [Armatimonadota bacterium]|nr:aldo/keto reductase [Armatimonadota bacterium]
MPTKLPVRKMGRIDFDATVLGLGCWAFGGANWGGQEDADSLATLRAALEAGITHFDTAQGYGNGRSERLVGEVVAGNQEVFVATKFNTTTQDPASVLAVVDESRERLRRDCIDLFYLHWPRRGVDFRPAIEGLERARSAGKIRWIGVSNFSVEQLEQALQAGRVDAHQFCYNLYWRYPERDVIPFAREHGIANVTYSSIAQGILTGKFGPNPSFPEGDLRPRTVLFDPDVYPHCYAGVEELKKIAAEAGRELVHLAIRWVAAQPGIDSVLVGARNPKQLQANVAAFEGEIAPEIFARMTAVSEEVVRHIPDTGNIFRYYP